MFSPQLYTIIAAEDTVQIADANLNTQPDEIYCDFGVTPEEMKRLEEREAKQTATPR